MSFQFVAGSVMGAVIASTATALLIDYQIAKHLGVI